MKKQITCPACLAAIQKESQCLDCIEVLNKQANFIYDKQFIVYKSLPVLDWKPSAQAVEASLKLIKERNEADAKNS